MMRFDASTISQLQFPFFLAALGHSAVFTLDSKIRSYNTCSSKKITNKNMHFRHFFSQSDLSDEDGLLRLKPISGFLSSTQSKKAFSTQLFSTENSDWRIQSSKNSTFSSGSSSRKTQSKKLSTCFSNRSHRSSHHQTHTHTATRPHTHTKYYTAVSYKALTLAWLSQLLLLAASQRGALLVLLVSSVYYTTTAAARGLDPMLPTTAAAAVTLSALG